MTFSNLFPAYKIEQMICNILEAVFVVFVWKLLIQSIIKRGFALMLSSRLKFKNSFHYNGLKITKCI